MALSHLQGQPGPGCFRYPTVLDTCFSPFGMLRTAKHPFASSLHLTFVFFMPKSSGRSSLRLAVTNVQENQCSWKITYQGSVETLFPTRAAHPNANTQEVKPTPLAAPQAGVRAWQGQAAGVLLSDFPAPWKALAWITARGCGQLVWCGPLLQLFILKHFKSMEKWLV